MLRNKWEDNTLKPKCVINYRYGLNTKDLNTN